jgi:hypothetical protein
MLYARAEELWQRLAAHDAQAVEELRSVLALVQSREETPLGDYTLVKSTSEAITMCLREANHPLTKREIVERLIAGGFHTRKGPDSKWLINDMLNHMLKKGSLVGKGERMDMIVDFPAEPLNKGSRTQENS